MSLADTKLYEYLSRGTEKSLRRCLSLIDKMSEEDVRLRDYSTKSTYLHHLVSVAPDVYEKHGDLQLLVPIIYRLALKNITVNAQNEHGNTCLHLACIRPNSDALCPHLIRIGADPCIMNHKQCRVIHTVRHNQCHLVKNQSAAKSGLWNAVDKEDLEIVESLLKCWCRVNIYKNKTIRNVGEETGNTKTLHLLSKYERTNEMVCAAYACLPAKVKEIIRSGPVDFNTCDHSFDVPKPLVVALAELGEVAHPVIDLIKQHGATSGNYFEKLSSMELAFEDSPFYKAIDEGTEASLEQALDLLTEKKVNVHLTSQKVETHGQTYLHFIVTKYYTLLQEDSELTCLLIRMIYRLALAGVNVHARDIHGNTALITAALQPELDQSLMNHLIRIGSDATLASRDGYAVNERVYEDKGSLAYSKSYRQSDLPGLWVAVKNNDEAKTERWLKSWARVNIYHGDRKLVDVARVMGHDGIVKLLEQYAHINEFVCTTFACDLKAMMQLLSLGAGQHKVNTIDDFFHVGFTWDRHAEFMARPIIVNAMEICNTEIVNFLLSFGADLSRVYEESYPCGPVAFWAFRDHVCNKNALVVAQHADVELRDENGCTMLHRLVQKKRTKGKPQIAQVLLDRGINLAARDDEGCTAEDYITIHDVEAADDITTVIDDFIIEQVNNDQHYWLESLVVDGYDRDIGNVVGSKRKKPANHIAELKEYKEIIALFHDMHDYKRDIEQLHEAAAKGDVVTMSRLAGEKRYAWSRHKSGRTLLHQGVLHEQPEVVRFICEQFPAAINTRDNLMRTPLHYCVTLNLSARRLVWPTLQDCGADPNLIDANNMSVYDYLREQESSTTKKEKPRGRRVKDYKPESLIPTERSKIYGSLPALYRVRKQLTKLIPEGASVKEVRKVTEQLVDGLGHLDIDTQLLQLAIDHKRTEIAKHLIICGARLDTVIRVTDEDNVKELTLQEYATHKDLDELSEFIRTTQIKRESGEPLTNGHTEEPEETQETEQEETTEEGGEQAREEQGSENVNGNGREDCEREQGTGSRRESVTSNRRESVTSNRRESVTSNRRESVTSNRRESVTSNRRESVTSNRRESVTSNKDKSTTSSRRESVQSQRRESVQSSK